jgi:hypothetical protein
VNNALLRHKLPFGAKADTPRPLDTYQFSHDAKVSGGANIAMGWGKRSRGLRDS